MILLEKVDVSGWETAIRGMRNPLNSWDKSDSDDTHVGEADLSLMKRLAHAGSDHGKFARMINVTLDITAPLYWFKEYDTYKVGTVANSTSTMHKIQAKKFTLDDFSVEHLDNFGIEIFNDIIRRLNMYREWYVDSGNKRYWWGMIQLLPSSYNQKRTVQLNYEVLKNMYFARKDHKLDEWRTFCSWIETLPHFKEIFLED